MSDSIWNTLSRIDCSEHVEKKGQFSYLAWTWAIAMVKEHYPLARFDMEDDVTFPDGSMEVRATITIGEQAHTQWLPVLDFKNNAIKNPNAFDVNTARMRCLVKGIAVGFGLGHYIYAGESMPQADPFTDEQKAQYIELMANGDGYGIWKFTNEVGGDVMNELFNAAPKGQKSKQKELARSLINEARSQLKIALGAITEAIGGDDASSLTEIFGEMSEIEIGFMTKALDEVQMNQIHQLGVTL